MNKLSIQSSNLGTMGRGVKRISEKLSEDPFWFGEAKNGDIKRKGLMGTKEGGWDGHKLPLSESLYLQNK